MYRFIFLITLLCASVAVARTNPAKLISSARGQIDVTTEYDPAYRRMTYPMGDVAPKTGVCADVIVRAYRDQGIDLQKLVHEDMRQNYALYPNRWSQRTTDTNIDHRRVPNLQVFLDRFAEKLPNGSDFKPGDIVTWNLNPKGFIPHIGFVSNRLSAKNTPMIIHNVGSGVQEEDILFQYKITGHYRY